jgi:hypothetical protein
MVRIDYEPSQLKASQQQNENYYHQSSYQVPSSPPVYETHQPAGYIETVPPPNIPQNCSSCTAVSEQVRMMQHRCEQLEKITSDLNNKVAFARDELKRLYQLLRPPQRQTEPNEREYREQQVPAEPPNYQPESGYFQQPTQMGLTEMSEMEYQMCTADWPSSKYANCDRVPTMAPSNQRLPVRQKSAITVPSVSTQNSNWTEIQL